MYNGQRDCSSRLVVVGMLGFLVDVFFDNGQRTMVNSLEKGIEWYRGTSLLSLLSLLSLPTCCPAKPPKHCRLSKVFGQTATSTASINFRLVIALVL